MRLTLCVFTIHTLAALDALPDSRSLILYLVRRQRRLVVFRSPELTHATTKEQIVTDPKYAAFTALDPFFDIVQQGLADWLSARNFSLDVPR